MRSVDWGQVYFLTAAVKETAPYSQESPQIPASQLLDAGCGLIDGETVSYE